MTAVKGSILGNAVLRREDPTLLTGEAVSNTHMTLPTILIV